jgi:hypothetical protein
MCSIVEFTDSYDTPMICEVRQHVVIVVSYSSSERSMSLLFESSSAIVTSSQYRESAGGGGGNGGGEGGNGGGAEGGGGGWYSMCDCSEENAPGNLQGGTSVFGAPDMISSQRALLSAVKVLPGQEVATSDGMGIIPL